jgi:diguanylate cyclase
VGCVSTIEETTLAAERPESPANRPDAAATVVLTMRQLGVPGLPRNYELFYEAVTAGRRDLIDALSELGSRPTQKQLDDVASRMLKRGNEAAVEEAHSKIITKLSEIIGLLRKERSSMETYGKILGETSTGLAAPQPLSREFLDRIISVTATATRTSLASQKEIVSSIGSRSSELQSVKLQLEEYKRLADTDALTQISNRRAFDRALGAIYDNNRNIVFSALILTDIDRFKAVNDRFGHPVGDRIIQIVANLIRSTVKADAFVARTGGEEFAIILEGCGEEATFRFAEDIRQAVFEAPFVNVAKGTNYGPITVSLGICMATQAQNPDDLYAKADRALYASKAAGRNRTTRFSTLKEGNFVKNWLLYRNS